MALQSYIETMGQSIWLGASNIETTSKGQHNEAEVL